MLLMSADLRGEAWGSKLEESILPGGESSRKPTRNLKGHFALNSAELASLVHGLLHYAMLCSKRLLLVQRTEFTEASSLGFVPSRHNRNR